MSYDLAALVVGFSVCGVCMGVGYGVGRIHAWRVAGRHERERTFVALSGGSWEYLASELEAEAVQFDRERCPETARHRRRMAERLRQRGRELSR